MEEYAYKIELWFNEDAELIHVESTEPMSLQALNEHLVVGVLFLAKEMSKPEPRVAGVKK
uniref:Uncharacterized protein n=1 Tax=viral metagenome TaxID=1070528 RepID=A0A6M3Y3M4_9ZZZZ